MLNIAYFISPHGFGHAGRSCALMQEITKHYKNVKFTIFGKTPRSFFETGGDFNFDLYEFTTDIGFFQNNPFELNIEKTLEVLHKFKNEKPKIKSQIKNIFSEQNFNAVISDISPLGIEIGNELNIPNFLFQNFTWDWLYKPYQKEHPKLKGYISELSKSFKTAKYIITSHPACVHFENQLSTNIIGRQPTLTRAQLLQKLNIPLDKKVILLTFGGTAMLEHLDFSAHSDYVILITDFKSDQIIINKNIIRIPSLNYYFPNLVNASDLVISKLGYGILAETLISKTPLVYIKNEGFIESAVLEEYIIENKIVAKRANLSNLADFDSHISWLEGLNKPADYCFVSGNKRTANLVLNRITTNF